jgi:hypothetical protein
VLALAVAEQRIVVTLNRRHFIRLHSTMPEHAGIVVCTFDPDFAALAQRIHTALEAQPQMAGQPIRVQPSSGVKSGEVAPQSPPVAVPNKGLQPTAYSVCSSVAPASGRG